MVWLENTRWGFGGPKAKAVAIVNPGTDTLIVAARLDGTPSWSTTLCRMITKENKATKFRLRFQWSITLFTILPKLLWKMSMDLASFDRSINNNSCHLRNSVEELVIMLKHEGPGTESQEWAMMAKDSMESKLREKEIERKKK